MIRSCLAVAWCVASFVFAQPQPQLKVDATRWSDQSVSITVELSADSTLVLGSAGKPWHAGVQLEISSPTGALASWPLKRGVPEGAVIRLGPDRGYSLTFKLDAKATQRLPEGVYEVIAVLDLRDSGEGWRGVVRSTPTDLTLGNPAPDVPPGKDVAALVRELATKTSPLQRRALVLALEGALLEAPELASGASLDAVVKAHLLQLGKRMANDRLYRTDFEADGPRNVLMHREVKLTPGRVTPGFVVKLAATGVRLSPPDDLAAFWKWIRDEQEEGLIIHPVRMRDGLARVATSAVPKGGPASRALDVSFWKQGPGGWELVSYEPWQAPARDWNSNVRRSGEPPKSAGDLTAPERAQWLELRLGLAEVAAPERRESGRGEALIGRAFGAWVFDAAYVPLLQQRLGKGSPAVQGAVLGLMEELKVEVPLTVALDLLPHLVSQEQRRAVAPLVSRGLAQLAPKMTAVSAEEIAGPAEGRENRTAQVVDDLAVVTVNSGFRGSQTLYRRTGSAWVEVMTLSAWVQ